MKLLAYDFGASSGRAVLGLYDGNRLDTEVLWRFTNDPVQVGQTLHWDVLRLLHETKQGLYAAKRVDHADLSGIGIDTWGVDFGLLDKRGMLLGNPVHYRDMRTAGRMAEAERRWPKADIYARTGIQFMDINTLYHLMALATDDPDQLERAETLLFTPDLMGYFLTGGKTCERTIASTSQMLNPVTGDWARDMLEALGVPTHMLLPVTDPLRRLGGLTPQVCEELGVGAIPVLSVGGHDTASAVVAVPAETADFAYLSSGTWSLMGVELPAPILTEQAFRLNVTNEGGVNRTTRLLKNIMGLWILQECKRDWDRRGEVVSFDELAAAAEREPAFACLIDPDAPEFGKPGHMEQKIRDYCAGTGQAVPQSKGAVVRCILESLAMKYRKTFVELESLTGKQIPILHVVGGGSRDALLNQFTADALNRPVMTGPSEATALGNLAGQLMALGEVAGLSQARDLIRNSVETGMVTPRNAAAWDTGYEKFERVLRKAEAGSGAIHDA
jgi:rhamnulokinase